MSTPQLQKIIEQLGFSAKEAKVYLTSLSLGECHVSDISKSVKIPRTTVQATLEKLSTAGLVRSYVICRYKYWVAENPDRLLSNFKKREEALRDALPDLLLLKNKNKKGKQKHILNKSLGIFQVLADSSSQPVLITNGEIEIEYVNHAWEKQFGYTLSEVRGQNPRILKSGKTPSSVHAKMWETLNSEKIFQSDQVIDKKKDGTYFNLLTTVFPVRHDGNIFFIQILYDITGRKRVNALKQSFITLG